MSSKNLAVVILNFNGRQHLETYLPSVLHYSEEADVIIADNASTDDSVSWLKTQYPHLERIELSENAGYAGGYNAALKQLAHPYFILLNSDVEVSPGWIPPLLELLKQEEVASVQPKILDYKQRNQFEYAGAAGGYLDILAYPFCRGRIFSTLEEDLGQYNSPEQVFWTSGACMAVNAKDFFDAGGFSADFFAHMEEIDLCWRWHHQGKECWVQPQSVVYHLGGGTLNKQSAWKTHLNFRNNLLMMYRNLSFQHAIYLIFIRLLLDGLAAIQLGLSQGPAHFKAVLTAHISFYRRAKKSRRELGPITRKNPWKNQHIMKKPIIMAYFLMRRKKFCNLKFRKF